MSKFKLDKLATSIKALENASNAIHIKSLRFPNYRNIQPNAILQFEFPITVLLGRNGCNKSSILHAIYGCESRQSVSDFWFETQLDAIPQTNTHGLKQSVTHTYVKDGVSGECIKARAPRGKADPDYWEAVKPTSVYGFASDAKRTPPIKVPIIHLDFRGELPAFDKYFYFPDPAHLSQRSKHAKKSGVLRRGYKKQDYLRRRSTHLVKQLKRNGVPISLEMIEILKYVLERDYSSGTILTHSLFHGHEGKTIQFKTKSIASGYSDAFAGSGESAAAFLIHNILSANDESIVLLDEPETSLHPRAQTRLLQFIAHYAARKSLQVVMATHSTHLAERLPQSAIRVLEMGKNDKVVISASHSAREAFHEIGTMATGKTIIVEDSRAKHIVYSELKAASLHARSEIRVVVRDGGTSRIFRDIQAYANSGTDNIFVIFDGDHRPEIDVPREGALPCGIPELDRIIKKVTSGPNKNGPDLDFVDANDRIRFLNFFRSYVRFLPGLTPELLIWNEEYAKRLVEHFSAGNDWSDDVEKEPDGKRKIEIIADQITGLDSLGVFQHLTSRFLVGASQERIELRNVVNEIRSR